MGRIADALKRAEEERRLALGASGENTGGVTTAVLPEPSEIPCVAADPARPIEIDAPRNKPLSDPEISQENGLKEGLSESLVPFFEPSSLVTEQYRSLRTRLLSQNPQYEHRILAITSAVPKEGKSVTSLNLGCILAEIRHLKVLVADGDFRRSSLAHMLGQTEGPGLADALAGDVSYKDILRETPIPNLRFIPAGSTNKRSAAELLMEPRARTLFKKMQNDFHYTIVDTPPATTVTDVGIIGQMCHGVIMIVRLHRTNGAAAKRAVRLLQVNNIPIMGCMIVGRDAPIDRYAYGYGYGYHNSYYRYYNYTKSEEDQN